MLLSQFIQASPSPLCPQVHSLHLCLYSCPIIGSLYFFIGLHSNPGKQVSWSTSFSVEAEAQSRAGNAQTRGEPGGTWSPDRTWPFYYSTLNCWWGVASPKKGILCISTDIAVRFFVVQLLLGNWSFERANMWKWEVVGFKETKIKRAERMESCRGIREKWQ